MPASIPAPMIVELPGGTNVLSLTCAAGTTDESPGTFALLSSQFTHTDGNDEDVKTIGFYSVQGGTPVLLNQTKNSAPFGTLSPFSQNSGFAVLAEVAPGSLSGSNLFNFAHDGHLVDTSVVTPMTGGASMSWVAMAEDPSGGFQIVRALPNGDSATEVILSLEPFDKKGQPVLSQPASISAASDGLQGPVAVGVALSGDVLVEATTADTTQRKARWFKRDATPLTDWFALSPTSNARYSFLIDGSLLRLADNGRSIVLDGQPKEVTQPAWLANREEGSVPYAIRQGKGYAVFNTAQCDSMEVLTPSGKSCGCKNLPGVTISSSVGRDGSVIVPSGSGSRASCNFQLYPGLLR